MLLRGGLLVCQASKRHPASRMLFSAHFSTQKPHASLVKTAPILSSSSSFALLAESGIFVDKSAALQDFLDYHLPIHLLLCPRRSGKTFSYPCSGKFSSQLIDFCHSFIETISDFFECASPNERGGELARRKDLFIKNNLHITKDARFEDEFGKYPVLYVDFSNVCGPTMATLLEIFRYHVTETALQLEESGAFENRGELPKSQLKFLEAVLNGTIPDIALPGILFKLTEILRMLHKKRVIVLVDEYDTPISFAVQGGYFPEANNFFRRVFSPLLKNNIHVRGALLVGILRAAKSGWLSGVNNISVFPLGQSSEYSTACMFTEDETRALYDRQVELQKPPFTFDDLNKWYNGYATVDGIKLFNPWSVANALTTGKLTTWWNESGYDATIQARVVELLGNDYEFRAQCQTLLDGDKININIEDINHVLAPNMTRDQLWTLMYYAGYLTTSSISVYGSTSVRIPNAEIHFEFRGWIQEEFRRRMTPELSETSVGQFDSLVNGYFAEFAESFGSFFFKEAPARLFGGRESAYQEYVYAYFSSAARAFKSRQKRTIKMEIQAGLGRADIVLYNEVGVVLEAKRFVHRNKEGYRDQERKQLSSGTKEALLQCDTRNYRSTLPEHVNTIYEYGLAFLGPYCAVEGRVLKKVNGTWVTDRVYTAEEDERRRQRTYCTGWWVGWPITAPISRFNRWLDAITGRNLYAKFYLETHAPTAAEFANTWKNLDHETAETWKNKARQMKKLHKGGKGGSRKESVD